MIRGTVLVIGRRERSLEVMTARLEREGYTVAFLAPDSGVYRWLRRQRPQAVLVSDGWAPRGVARLARWLRAQGKTRYTPLILVTTESGASKMSANVGEVFALDSLALAEIVRRLALAVELSEITAANRLPSPGTRR